jgi:5'-phosphate synthase pdxT subunit
MVNPRTFGVLALQGAFARHRRSLEALGSTVREVRLPRDLDGIAGLVLPGGESTTLCRLLETSGLREPLGEAIRSGLPTLGTCAGMILLASEVADGRDDQWSYGAIDIDVRRNAYGRQLDSFEGVVRLVDDPEPFPAVFIRAPRVVRLGEGVEVLGRAGDEPVLVRERNVIVAAFHPELTDDLRIHSRFAETVCSVA